MYRLMIIDDDKAIREHIKESIPWESMELELAAKLRKVRKRWLFSCNMSLILS